MRCEPRSHRPPPRRRPPTTTTTRRRRCACRNRASGRTRRFPRLARCRRAATWTTIQHRGRLIVGVDQNTLLFGYRDPITGDIDGLDVALAHEIARGDLRRSERDRTAGGHQRAETERGQERQGRPRRQPDHRHVCASARGRPQHRVLRGTSAASGSEQGIDRQRGGSRGEESVRDQRDRPPSPTSSRSRRRRRSIRSRTAPTAWSRSRKGSVDAITSDDTILLGFEIQDPVNTKILPASQLEDEPYGLATSKEHDDFGRFVNSVLEQLRANGRLEQLYQTWLNTPDVGFTPPASPPHGPIPRLMNARRDRRHAPPTAGRRRRDRRQPARARARPEPQAARDRDARRRDRGAVGRSDDARSPTSGSGSPASPSCSNARPRVRGTAAAHLGRPRGRPHRAARRVRRSSSPARRSRSVSATLLGDRQATTRCTPDELLTMMSEQFDQALRVVVAAGAAWDTLVPRLRDARVAARRDQHGCPRAWVSQPMPSSSGCSSSSIGSATRSPPIPSPSKQRDFDALEAELAGLRGSLDARHAAARRDPRPHGEGAIDDGRADGARPGPPRRRTARCW